MTQEERLRNIQTKAKRDAAVKAAAENAEKAERNELIQQIKDMYERITDLIALANACIDNGIAIPQAEPLDSMKRSGEPWGYPYEFIAEGIYHHTGFIKQNRTITYIGIKNGGANGTFDFWTDGLNVWHVHEQNKSIKREPSIYDLQKFLREFPKFEEAFLKFVDEM